MMHPIYEYMFIVHEHVLIKKLAMMLHMARYMMMSVVHTCTHACMHTVDDKAGNHEYMYMR